MSLTVTICLNAAAIRSAEFTPRTKAVLLTNPGNPTGVVYTQEEMDMISAIVRKYDLALIADEVYREFVYDGAYRSFGTMPELADNLIIIDSVSKRYSACGARIGCIISKNKELAKQIIKCSRPSVQPDSRTWSAQPLYILLPSAIWRK